MSTTTACGTPVSCGTATVASLTMFGQVDGYVLDISSPSVVGIHIANVAALDPGFFVLCELYGPSP